MKKTFLLSGLFALAACAEPQFVLVTLAVPAGTTAPSADTLDVTISGEPDGQGAEKTVSFSLEGKSLPTSFFLEFRPERKGLPIELALSGKQAGIEVFTAEGAAKVGSDVKLTAAFCGDLFLDETKEECDDGNRQDSDSCEANCTSPFCGNLIIDSGEECDDGNQDDTDECNNLCKTPVCGDGLTQGSEECDNGALNADAPNACHLDCTNPICGDGLLDTNFAETCDDGNNVDADGCESDCTLPACQNGVVDPGEICFQDFVSLATGLSPVDIALGDLTGDGLLELAVANSGSDSITLYTNQGSGQFVLQTTPAIGAPQTSIQIADLNPETNNQRPDIVVGDTLGNLDVLKQNTNGSLTKQFIDATNIPTSLCIDDFNIDGQGFPDVAALDQFVSMLFFGNQSPGTNNVISLAAPSETRFNLTNVDMIQGDFDQDPQGKLDLTVVTFLIVSPSSAKLDLQFLSGNGDGTFAPRVTFTGTTTPTTIVPPEGPHQLVKGDLNQDGRLDLVFLVPGQNSLVFLLGDAQATFAPAQLFALSFAAKALALADLSGDGIDELIVTNQNQLVIFPGLGGAQFGAPLSLAAGSSPVAPSVADLNNDGAPDVVLAEKGSAFVRVFFATP